MKDISSTLKKVIKKSIENAHAKIEDVEILSERLYCSIFATFPADHNDVKKVAQLIRVKYADLIELLAVGQYKHVYLELYNAVEFLLNTVSDENIAYYYEDSLRHPRSIVGIGREYLKRSVISYDDFDFIKEINLYQKNIIHQGQEILMELSWIHSTKDRGPNDWHYDLVTKLLIKAIKLDLKLSHIKWGEVPTIEQLDVKFYGVADSVID